MTTKLMAKNLFNRLTVFFFEPTTWHGHMIVATQRLLGFDCPYSHVAVAFGNHIYDLTLGGIEFFNGEDAYHNYYIEAADVYSFDIASEDCLTAYEFCMELYSEDYAVEWQECIQPILLYLIGTEAREQPLSCTSPAIMALPVEYHPLAFLPGCLMHLLDKLLTVGYNE